MGWIHPQVESGQDFTLLSGSGRVGSGPIIGVCVVSQNVTLNFVSNIAVLFMFELRCTLCFHRRSKFRVRNF